MPFYQNGKSASQSTGRLEAVHWRVGVIHILQVLSEVAGAETHSHHRHSQDLCRHKPMFTIFTKILSSDINIVYHLYTVMCKPFMPSTIHSYVIGKPVLFESEKRKNKVTSLLIQFQAFTSPSEPRQLFFSRSHSMELTRLRHYFWPTSVLFSWQ